MNYTDVFGTATLPPAELGYQSLTLTVNTTFNWPYNSAGSSSTIAKIMDMSCSSGVVMTLPPADQVSVGEDFLIRNIGAQPLAVHNNSGVAVATVAAGAAVYFYLTDNTTTGGVFGTVAYGVGSSAVDAASLVGYGIKALGNTLNQSHVVTQTSSDLTLDATYRSKLLVCTGGATVLALPSVATVGNDFFFMLNNAGSGTVTLNPDSTQLVDGQLTLDVQPGESCILVSSGSAWYSVGRGRSTLFQFTQLVKDVSAGGTISLTSAEVANKLLTFIGSPAADLTVVIPGTVAVYYVNNAISTAYNIEIKTTTGTGSTLAQNSRAILLCDGTDVVSAQTAIASSTVSLVDGSAAAPALNFASQTNTGLYKQGAEGMGIAVDGTSVAEFEDTRAMINVPQDYVKLKINSVAPSTAEGVTFYDGVAKALTFYTDTGPVQVTQGGSGDVTLNGVQTLTNKTITGLRETAVAMAGSTTDTNLGNYFILSGSGTITLSVTNAPNGKVTAFILDITNGGTITINWWPNIKWRNGLAPSLTAAGRDVLGFYTYDGVNYVGLVLANGVA